jgi:type VI protein secretion system component Hcp
MPVAAHYLEILDQDGFRIDGESEAHGYEQYIDVNGWDWDVTDQSAKSDTASRTGQTGGGATSSAESDEVGIDPSLLTFRKPVDRSTTRLMMAMYRGDVLQEATFTLLEEFLNADDEREIRFRLRVKLENVIVVSYELGGRASEHRVDLDETWQLSYSNISLNYESPKGHIHAGFPKKPGSTKRGASKPAPEIDQLQKELQEIKQAANGKKRG